MATNPKQPRQSRKPSAAGARRGRPRKNPEADPKKRADMPLPSSLLDTTIADGEGYRPGSGGPAADPTPPQAPPTPPEINGNAPPVTAPETPRVSPA